MSRKLTARSRIPTQSADLGLKVNVGARPEDFLETGDEPIFAGEAAFSEALGEVTRLYFKRHSERAAQIVAKLPGIPTGLRSRHVRLGPKPEKVHIFADGVSLLYR